MTALPRVTLFAIPAMICTSDLHADVSYVEEIVNSGIGAAKVGARKTVRKVYVKGEGQHVRDEVRKGGVVEVGSTIVRLDRLNRYRIDHASKTFTEHKLSPRATAAKADWWQASQGGPAGAGKRVATAAPVASKAGAADPNREVKFETKVLPDTMRVEGILCHRVAAQMRARYYVPGTKEVKRENRYLYQAWMATDFPGYADIQRFEAQREAKTSLPSQIASAGLSEFKDAVEDYDRLDEEMKALEGFPIQSQLKVFTKMSSSSKDKELFRLSRKISSLSHSNLSPSLFDVSLGLRRVEVEANP